MNDGSEYPILWMRIDKAGKSFPISTGDTLMANDKRFDLDTNDTYTLSIRDVKPSDAATYQCQVRTDLKFECIHIMLFAVAQ